MTVWCHLPTIFKQRHALRLVGLLTLCVALTTTLLFANVSHASTGVNQTLSFQGRLLSSTGAVVPDGYYNLQFKIYQDGDGTTAGDSGGSLKWTETYINNGGTSGVEVKDGFFSVNLGSENPFGTQVDWNQDTLWLSMNVAGSSSSCTTFNSGTCLADGEMLPMKRITSTPYALNSGELGGKTADNFLQLAQGVQTDASTNTSSIFINKTGTGNLIQLQNSGNDVLTVNNSGDMSLGYSSSGHVINVADAGSGANGSNLFVGAGNGGTGGADTTGGSLILQGGDGSGTSGTGGGVYIDSGTGGGGGTIAIGGTNATGIAIGATSGTSTQYIFVGTNNTAGSTSNVTLGAGASAAAGSTTIQSKDSTTISTNGTTRATFDGSGNLTLSTANQLNSTTTVANNQILGFGIQGTSGNYTLQAAGSGSYLYSDGNNLHIGATTYGTAGSSANPTNVYNDALTVTSAGGLGTSIRSGVTYGPNLIDNGGFEAADCNGWKGDCQYDNSVVHSGQFAGSYAMPSATSTGSLVAPGLISAQPGDIFYAEGWLRTSASTTGTASVQICYDDKYGTWLGTCDYSTPTNPGSTWTLSTVTGSPAPTGTAYVSMKFYNNGDGTTTGTWYYDDMYVAKVNHQESALYKNSTDSSNAFQVQDSSSNSLFNIDTSGHDIKIGNNSGTTTLLTLDQAASAPSVTGSAMLGSMYYDTTLGQLQCYEASGWGDCSAKPDSFITLSPEYAGAVMHGSGSGTMTEDLCSDTLHINDGTSSQPTVCNTNETYNYYDWSSTQTTNQTDSIFVTYQLPTTFKNFVSGVTSLMGRSDSADSSVNYQIYRNNSSSGLIACGSTVTVSSGSQTSWQKGTASGSADPSSCSFAAGDSIVFKINLTAKNSANAYVSNLNFAFSNN